MLKLFFLKHWRLLAEVALLAGGVAALYFGIQHALSNARDDGFKDAQSQYSAAVVAANTQAARDQMALNVFKQKYDDLSAARQTQVVTVTKPIIERVTREVQSAPVYRDCKLTDGVFHDLEAERAAVNASIGSSQR